MKQNPPIVQNLLKNKLNNLLLLPQFEPLLQSEVVLEVKQHGQQRCAVQHEPPDPEGHGAYPPAAVVVGNELRLVGDIPGLAFHAEIGVLNRGLVQLLRKLGGLVRAGALFVADVLLAAHADAGLVRVAAVVDEEEDAAVRAPVARCGSGLQRSFHDYALFVVDHEGDEELLVEVVLSSNEEEVREVAIFLAKNRGKVGLGKKSYNDFLTYKHGR